jgi:hypothetical protein
MEQESASLRQRQFVEAMQQPFAGTPPEGHVFASHHRAHGCRPVLPGRALRLPRLVGTGQMQVRDAETRQAGFWA